MENSQNVQILSSQMAASLSFAPSLVSKGTEVKVRRSCLGLPALVPLPASCAWLPAKNATICRATWTSSSFLNYISRAISYCITRPAMSF